MGLIERWGSGTLRIADELKSANHPSPEFIANSGRFEVVFYRKEQKEELPILVDDFNKLSFSVRQLLAIDYLKEHHSITNAEYQEIAEISKRTATRELSALTSMGVLITTGGSRGRGKQYRLKTG